MIGFIGLVILLPIALVALALGLVRFGLNALYFLASSAVARVVHSG